MPEQHAYEYSFIRIVPRVERGEFLNAGVMLYCKRKRFLGMLYHIDGERIQAFAPNLDLDELMGYIQAWEKICAGAKDGGRIAELDQAQRFRWLSATKSTILQTSEVHPGLCADPEGRLKKLFERYVK